MAGVPAGRLSIEIVAEIARLQSDLDKAKRAVNAASKDMARSAGAVNDNFGKMAKMSGNAAFAARNLGFQLQDVVTQLSLGQSPMKVFAAQGFQIADALGQMRREAQLTGQSVGGMFYASMGKAGPAILAAGVALGALAAALKIVQDDLNETGQASLSFSDVALGAFDALRAFTVDQLGPAFTWLADMAGQAWGYISNTAKQAANIVIGIWVAVPNTLYAAFTTLPQAIAELFVNMANGAIKAIEDLVNKAINGLNSFSGMVNGLLGTSIGGVGNVSFGRIENTFAGAGKRAGVAMASGFASGFSDHVGKLEEFIRPFAEARRVARMAKDAEDAGGKAGRAAGKAAGKAGADESAKWLEQLAKDTSESFADLNKELDKTVEALMKIGAAELDKILEQIGTRGEAYVAKLNDELAITLEQVDAIVSALGNMRGLGGVFGDIGSVLTSKNPIASMLGMGGVGTILGSVLGGQDVTDKLGEQFQKSLVDVFGVKGDLAKDIGSTLANLFQGSAIGGSVGTVLGGGKGGALGASLGGALGQAVGGKVLSSLGAAAGPVGAIAGAILGNVIGGMISGTKRGGATIGAGGISGTWGNSQSRIGAASGMGNNAVDALSQLADALGVSLGSFSSSVSVRKNDLRFDPTGSGISKTGKGAISFGQDEEALMKAVIVDAIKDGALPLGKGFVDYLTSGDVEARLQDVLNIKSVMNEAAQLRDPQGYALSELDKWRTSMLAIATATGEGMADIEFVFGERRKEILSQFTTDTVQLEKDRKSLLIQIAELEGRSTEALAMAREMEKSAADASLGTLYDRIYALQDEAVAAQAAAQAAQALAAIQTEARSYFEQQTRLEADIMRLQGDEAGALKLERQLELYAMEEGLRALAIRKYALQDEAAVTAAATQALQAATNEREGLIRRLLTLAGDTAALRAKDLAALSPANRELQKMIWSVEDIASEAEKTVAANNTLIASYKSQADAAESLAARYDAFAADIRKYKMDLIAPAVPGAAGARFDKIAAMARLGDETALAGFTGAAGAYLENARNTAGSFAEYQRALIKVIGQSELAASGADGLSKAARAQIGAIAETTAALEAANVLAETEAQEAAKRFVEQIEALGDLDFIQTETLDAVNNQTDVLGEKLEAQAVTQGELLSAINALRFEMAARDEPATIALGRIESYLRTASRGDYLAVGGIDTDGLTVTTV